MLTLVLVTLLDGSSVNLKVPPDTILDFKTAYGDLKIPLKHVTECELGVHVDNPDEFEEAIAHLSSKVYANRDFGMKFLAKYQRGAYRYLKECKAKDAETMRRIELLLREYKELTPLKDTITTKDGTFTGHITQTKLSGHCEALGALDVRLSQVRSFYLRLQKTKLTLTPGGWTEVGRIGGRLKITASGEIDLWSQTPGAYVATPGRSNYQSGGLPAGALIGRINGGSPFLVGESYTAQDMARGKLELRINDSCWPGATQSGSYEVEVE